ncbi:hypothetical protein, no similarity (partial), partial [Maudiozyma saulgeensis]
MHNAIKENDQLSEANSSSAQEGLTCKIYYIKTHKIQERILRLEEITEGVLHPLLTETSGCLLIIVMSEKNAMREALLNSYNEWLSMMGNPIEAADRFKTVSFCGFMVPSVSDKTQVTSNTKEFTYYQLNNFAVMVGDIPDINFSVNELSLLESPEVDAIRVNYLGLLYLKYYFSIAIKYLMHFSFTIEDICESKELKNYENKTKEMGIIHQDTLVIDFILNYFYKKSNNNYIMRRYVQECRKNVAEYMRLITVIKE